MKILAIDTANNFLSLAISDNNYQCLTYCENVGNKQSEHIFPSIQDLLTKHGTQLDELTAISYNCGPGGFTGLRIGLSAALALAYSKNLPLYPVSMLQMYHQQSKATIICLDAKLGQIYLAAYAEDNQVLITPCLINPTELLSHIQQANLLHSTTTITGNGWNNYQTIFVNYPELQLLNYINSDYPSAKTMIQLIQANQIIPCRAQQAELLYLRNKVALNLVEQQQAKNQ